MNDLRDHLFAALERLDNDELTAEDLQKVQHYRDWETDRKSVV